MKRRKYLKCVNRKRKVHKRDFQKMLKIMKVVMKIMDKDKSVEQKMKEVEISNKRKQKDSAKFIGGMNEES